MTYTREQILNMPVGYELDRLIASQIVLKNTVLDAPVQFSDSDWFRYHHDLGLFRYSTEIRDAWVVVEKLSQGRTNNSFFLELHYERYYARFGTVPRDEMYKTVPEAICKAALLASLGESGGTGDERS